MLRTKEEGEEEGNESYFTYVSSLPVNELWDEEILPKLDLTYFMTCRRINRSWCARLTPRITQISLSASLTIAKMPYFGYFPNIEHVIWMQPGLEHMIFSVCVSRHQDALRPPGDTEKCTLPNLRELWIKTNTISWGAFPGKQVEYLRIDLNQQITEDGLFALKMLKHLEMSQSANGLPLERLSEFKHLVTLELVNVHSITDEHLETLPKLTTLCVDKCMNIATISNPNLICLSARKAKCTITSAIRKQLHVLVVSGNPSFSDIHMVDYPELDLLVAGARHKHCVHFISNNSRCEYPHRDSTDRISFALDLDGFYRTVLKCYGIVPSEKSWKYHPPPPMEQVVKRRLDSSRI